MKRLLFLAHRIPFPPDKGDKIRSFNILRHLSTRFEVSVGAFVDDPSDWNHAGRLREICRDVELVGINPRWRKVCALNSLVSGESLSVPYYRSRRMSAWVRTKLLTEGIRYAFAFSSTMAQYILGGEYSGVRRVLDMVDVDSEKWRQYGTRHRFPMNWLYAREARTLMAFEARAAAECDATLLVTEQEADLFRRQAPRVAPKVVAVPNGVDTDYFQPGPDFPNPYKKASRVLVFTGAMDYWANADAVEWFADAVFPMVRKAVPEAEFYIVGARPIDRVKALSSRPGVVVTGAVDDVRPYLHHAAAAVAPLRVARGIQNKVLEAFAMAKPVLATPAAMEGIEPGEALIGLVEEDPGRLAELAVKVLRDPKYIEAGLRGREFVQDRFGWQRSFALLDEILDRQTAAAA